jgi:VWFA-related protein
MASVLSPAQDRVAVVSFSEKPNYLQVLTPDLSAAERAIDQIRFEPPPGYAGRGVVVSTNPPKAAGPVPGSTSLWDVIRSATTELFAARPDGRRRTMLLFTDGTDTSSSSKFKGAIDGANKYDLSVFIIGLADTENFLLKEEPLKKLSEQTGGIVRFPGNKKAKLEAALTEIARHFRGNYVVGYCGGAAKDQAKLQLEIVDPEIRKAKPVLAYKRY